MIIAFVVPLVGGRDVTRAKKLMSVFMRGQGRVPPRPIPSLVLLSSGVGVDAVLGGTRSGVVATIRVRGGLFGGGILRVGLEWMWVGCLMPTEVVLLEWLLRTRRVLR